MVFTKPVRKKRNFKSLTLAVPENATPPGGGTVSGPALQLPVNTAPAHPSSMVNVDPVLPLELGVELRLDLREEDLVIGEPMGEGSGGTVVKAIHRPTQTPMAMKFIRADYSIRQQILKELQILHECNSPYIVSFYGAYPKDNGVQVCMEFMDQRSFDRIYRKTGPIPVPVLGCVTFSVLQGLKYLYEDLRVMHRDIKPSNILLNSYGFIKLCDFGISKEMVNSIANTFVGTASYMSPERMNGGSYTVKSDIWSFGLTLMELALGRYPLKGEGESMSIFEMLSYITNETLPQLDDEVFPKGLCDLVAKCLIKDPAKRPALKDLLNHPYTRECATANVNIEQWAKFIELPEF
ncbi:MAP kinase kinase (MEK) [Coemansia spiralis]|uniref:MAP kinase kinase (MEK) n=2 Tax=Coemansia TaxID=4863 RepID=A0A9W8G531_9FUNG|nr:kinase-like domain-containing protein [Coemansia spiralis]KAJ1990843.1 MAP kinase kinase (MEK) [Coemansia umbellata]KAJ2622629.1 MAP kinase kinase (MEK) [Coemansia sp. RSA 1358]KAJ2674577.1 MAP kinase kinase (MEK) [Coemansia spiralis]